MVDSETKGARREASLQFLVNLKLKTQNSKLFTLNFSPTLTHYPSSIQRRVPKNWQAWAAI